MEMLFSFAALAALVVLITYVMKRRNRRELPSEGKLVVVTGCDSGFGEGIAKRLHSMGYTVVATCLQPDTAPIRSLASETFHVTKVDVTDLKDVVALRDLCLDVCEKNHLRFWGLVNNAGIGWGALFEMMTMEEFRSIFEVNYFAAVRLCQIFLPILRQSGGRIVNMVSGSALLPVSLITSYGGSKAALYYFSRCLQGEVGQFGILVVSVCPWFFRTPLVERVIGKTANIWDTTEPDIVKAYGGDNHRNFTSRVIRQIMTDWDTDLTPVIDCAVSGIAHTNPRPLYTPGKRALTVVSWFINALPSRITDGYSEHTGLESLMLRLLPIAKA